MTNTYTIIIALVAILIIAAVIASAFQQRNEQRATKIREEISKHRSILEQTEIAVSAAQKMPLSKRLVSILRQRSLYALEGIYEQNPTKELKKQMDELKGIIGGIDIDAPAPDQSKFVLPNNDKIIVKYIQALKKFRSLLKSEHKKKNISAEVFKAEDQSIEELQLRVTMEALKRRAQEAINHGMRGSAKPPIDKALSALSKLSRQTEYSTKMEKEFKTMLSTMDSQMEAKKANHLAENNSDNRVTDDLFEKKQKW